jgi:hypothetical protein
MFLGLQLITISKMKTVIGQEFTNLKPSLSLSTKNVTSTLNWRLIQEVIMTVLLRNSLP